MSASYVGGGVNFAAMTAKFDAPEDLVSAAVVADNLMMALVFIIMWVRFTYPRFREDQLQRFAWKVLIPVSLANIAITAILKVAV